MANKTLTETLTDKVYGGPIKRAVMAEISKRVDAGEAQHAAECQKLHDQHEKAVLELEAALEASKTASAERIVKGLLK